MFKAKLDKYLASVPDEPQIPGYTSCRRADSNSLIDMVKSAESGGKRQGSILDVWWLTKPPQVTQVSIFYNKIYLCHNLRRIDFCVLFSANTVRLMVDWFPDTLLNVTLFWTFQQLIQSEDAKRYRTACPIFLLWKQAKQRRDIFPSLEEHSELSRLLRLFTTSRLLHQLVALGKKNNRLNEIYIQPCLYKIWK